MKVVIAALHKMQDCVSVVCLEIRVLSIVRIFLGYPYFMAINSVNKTVVGYSSRPEQARLQLNTTREATELRFHCKIKNAFLSVW